MAWAEFLSHSIKRASRRVDLPPREIKKLISQGELTPVFLGPRMLLLESDLTNMLHRHREGYKPEEAGEETAGE